MLFYADVPHRLQRSCSKPRALAGLTDSNQLAGITTSSFSTGAQGLFPLPQSPLVSLHIGTHTMALCWENPAWRQGIEPNDLLTSLPPLVPGFRITQHAHGPMKLATLSGNTRLFSILQLPGAVLDKTCSRLFFPPQDLWKPLGLFDINLCPHSPTNDLPLTFGYWREKRHFSPNPLNSQK